MLSGVTDRHMTARNSGREFIVFELNVLREACREGENARVREREREKERERKREKDRESVYTT